MNRPNDRVRDPAASARKQLMDAGHLQTVGRQPLVDLVRPGDKDILGRRLHLPRAAQDQPHQAGQLIFTRKPGRLVSGPASTPALMYLRTVFLDSPVPLAICR